MTNMKVGEIVTITQHENESESEAIHRHFVKQYPQELTDEESQQIPFFVLDDKDFMDFQDWNIGFDELNERAWKSFSLKMWGLKQGDKTKEKIK